MDAVAATSKIKTTVALNNAPHSNYKSAGLQCFYNSNV